MNSNINTGSRAPLAVSLAVVLACVFGAATLLVIAPSVAHADQPEVSPSAADRAEVSLKDLNLATAEGKLVARDRLSVQARRLCADSVNEHSASFNACVDSTVANAWRQINESTSITAMRATDVSMADLNLATSEGRRAARERLQPVARRLCYELVYGGGLSYQSTYTACVRDSLAGALAQVNALAQTQVARTAAAQPSGHDPRNPGSK